MRILAVRINSNTDVYEGPVISYELFQRMLSKFKDY